MGHTISKHCEDCRRMHCTNGCVCDCHPTQGW